MITWQWNKFQDISTQELYAILALRQKVFSVEQNCAYLDADGKDLVSYHLLGWTEDKGRLSAYLRVVPPGYCFKEHSIGRVVTHPNNRGTGLGKLLLREGMERIFKIFGNVPIRISAQAYLENFYQSFGFLTQGQPYLEDSILHIEMLRH